VNQQRLPVCEPRARENILLAEKMEKYNDTTGGADGEQC
jgi:hypothetical protein